MSSDSLYLTACAILLTLSVLTILVFQRYLTAVLAELTGTIERARFWRTFIAFLLVMIPQLVGMFFASSIATTTEDDAVLFLIVDWLRWPVAALITTLLVVAASINGAVRNHAPTEPPNE